MADDSCSVDSESSRLSDLQDVQTSADSGKNTSESTPQTGDITADKETVPASVTRNICDTNKVIDKDTIVNELVVGPNVESSEAGSVLALGLKEAGPLGQGVSEIVQECMNEGSEDSRDSTNGAGDELDLTGIDDEEISKVCQTVGMNLSIAIIAVSRF